MVGFLCSSGAPERIRLATRSALAAVLAVGLTYLGPSSAYAQAAGPIGSLGGYGAMASSSTSASVVSYSSAMGASSLAPFSGRFGAAMPSGMGGGSPLLFTPRTSAVMSSSRPSFTIGPMGSGMASMQAGGGPTFGRRPFVLRPLETSTGTGAAGAIDAMPGAGRMGIMPPSFGYPFWQPPSFFSSTPGTGMSM